MRAAESAPAGTIAAIPEVQLGEGRFKYVLLRVTDAAGNSKVIRQCGRPSDDRCAASLHRESLEPWNMGSFGQRAQASHRAHVQMFQMLKLEPTGGHAGGNVQVVVRGHPSAPYHDDIRRAVQRKLEPQGFQANLFPPFTLGSYPLICSCLRKMAH